MSPNDIAIVVSVVGAVALILYLFCHHAWAKRQSFSDPYAEQFGDEP